MYVLLVHHKLKANPDGYSELANRDFYIHVIYLTKNCPFVLSGIFFIIKSFLGGLNNVLGYRLQDML